MQVPMPTPILSLGSAINAWCPAHEASLNIPASACCIAEIREDYMGYCPGPDWGCLGARSFLASPRESGFSGAL